MSKLFLYIINMSISSGYVVLAILLLRLLLKRTPKWINVLLWGVVGIRLCCPFTLESAISLIPSSKTVSLDIMTDITPEINTGIPIINSTLNPIISGSFAPDPTVSANPLQILIPILATVWIIGMSALTLYAVISCIILKNRIGTAILQSGNVYMSEGVASPFVLGVIKPRIYLPFNIDEKLLPHVIAHEQAHIHRRDYLWNPIGFLLLTIHWFNPLMWLGYILLCRDIELACDEKVVMGLSNDERADYSEALLACSVNRRWIAACPLAFGEVGVKDRVKSVLNYKKPAFWIIVTALILCLAVSVCFLTDPKDDKTSEFNPELLTKEQREVWEKYPEYFGLDSSQGLDVYVCQFALGNYSFILTPYSDTKKTWTELVKPHTMGASAESMKIILSSYGVDVDDVRIIPWQNPVSSYIAPYWMRLKDEDPEIRQAMYIDNIRSMLLGTSWGHRSGSGNESPLLLYSTPSMSYVDSYVPRVRILDNRLYNVDTGKVIGTLKQFYLTPASLDDMMDGADLYGELTSDIMAKNVLAYEITPTEASNIDLYYLLAQNDGSFIIVYGHYDNGEKSDFIRWIFDTGSIYKR